MDDTTETLTRPGFPPPAAPSAPAAPPAPWPRQLSQAAPLLPSVTPHAPRQATVNTNSHPNLFPNDLLASSSPGGPAQRREGGSLRRAARWLFVLALLAGVGYAGVTYGPDLMEQITGSDALGQPSAPLQYPVPTAAPDVIRTATFTISGPGPFGGAQNYEVTADFESGVTQVVVPRVDTPDLVILTLWDQAFIRRLDDPTWYSMPRGDFPIDFSLGRARWVRTLDELIPEPIRQLTTIEDAHESSVGSEPARHLVVSVDPDRLLQARAGGTTPAVDGSVPPPVQLPQGIRVQPSLDGDTDLTMEIWIDDSGIVRQSVMPAELGGETITVTSVSSEPWQPLFPGTDTVQPLTAQALFLLGI